ncbi:hypothetical protein L226DRAFT_455316 [Lentinus tigrinus ALCF2SS1-7]|uniref:RBR-type E3 ubiquitin transferase n=1 Tax=Lentinus tigrinus ALCF2SS1-6 TaxID=1328759 RepID=A0A5C2SPA8_9APHY|nr:hypothetical protein L227DRAFT_494197 [Lentinus tigrinus ALCF2SS1-6]RPD78929.1 hypothetical protein L226DRAFT_455316 [Lentinus tigrinus ALCF2SS1-7]
MDASARTGDPLVPPGLGLESVVANGGDGTLPRQSETVTITVHDSTKVTFSSGFGVVQVITSFESRQIILQNVPPTVTRRDITTTLQTTFGEIVAVLPGDSQDGPLSWRITFAQADAAAEASAALNGSCLFDVRVTARMAEKKSVGIGGGTLFDGDVLFELPTPRLKAYIGYETKEQADRAIALSNRKEIKGMWVTAGMYQGIPMVGAFNVRIEGLHPDSTVKDLGQFGKFQTHMFERPKYTSMPAAISALHNILLRKDERVTINVLPPPYRKMFRIWAHFSDKAIAKATCEDLHKFCPSFTGKLRIYAHHITSLRYNLPPAIFDIIAYDINLLRDYNLDDKGTSISVIDRRQGASSPTAPVLVKLVSQDMSALSRLKAGFDQLLRGEKVTENGQVVWNDFFKSPAGMEYLAELEKMYPKVRINRDPRRRTLALFGREPHRSRVREEIIARTRLLKAQRQRRYPVAGDLIGVFMSEDLFKLQSELGHDNVWFDLTNKELVVRGDENAQKVAGLAVRHAVQRRQRRVAPADAACTVCFDDVSHPITLSCGHRWCRDCLTGYMHASVDNKTFPLKCLGDDAKCPQCIPLALAQELLTPDEFDAIVRASFLAHVQSRPDEFHYCPTPDCPQVYHKTKRNTILQCPSCLVRICPHCDTEWHQNGSCQESDPQDDLLFEQWKSRHDVKDCPSCKVPIERMAGCNHMTCVSCKTHICWACLATFPTSQEVYDHMRGIHGGIGL